MPLIAFFQMKRLHILLHSRPRMKMDRTVSNRDLFHVDSHGQIRVKPCTSFDSLFIRIHSQELLSLHSIAILPAGNKIIEALCERRIFSLRKEMVDLQCPQFSSISILNNIQILLVTVGTDRDTKVFNKHVRIIFR